MAYDPAPALACFSMALSPQQLKDYTMSGLQGNHDSVYAVFEYYMFYKDDGANGLKWAYIGAENGDSRMQYNLAQMLYQDDKSDIRSVYWLFISAEVGDNSANEDIQETHMQFKFAADSDYMTIALTENTTEVYADGALRGSGFAALSLAEYYDRLQQPKTSRYWYRIGAQNGNAECQIRLGELLRSNLDSESIIRAAFGLERVLKSQ